MGGGEVWKNSLGVREFGGVTLRNTLHKILKQAPIKCCNMDLFSIGFEAADEVWISHFQPVHQRQQRSLKLSADSLWGACLMEDVRARGQSRPSTKLVSSSILIPPVLVRWPLPRLLGHEFFVLEIARQPLSKFLLHLRDRRQTRSPSGLFLLSLIFEGFLS